MGRVSGLRLEQYAGRSHSQWDNRKQLCCSWLDPGSRYLHTKEGNKHLQLSSHLEECYTLASATLF